MEKHIKGRLIAIDGLDASGKGTQTDLLCKYLAKNNMQYTKLSFPDYSMESSILVKMYLRGDFGKNPEDVNPYAASSFFSLDRYASFKLKWKKDYDDGKVLVADRYTTANAVHQLSKLKISEWEYYLDWLDNYEFELLGLPRPDKVIYLCVPPEISIELIDKRCSETGVKKDIHESNLEYIQRSYKAALFASEYFGWTRINCAKDGKMRSKEDIHREVVEICNTIINKNEE